MHPNASCAEKRRLHGRDFWLESKLLRKHVLNLLNEPRYLAKIKTKKLLKNSKHRGNKFMRTKAQNHRTKLRRITTYVQTLCPVQRVFDALVFFVMFTGDSMVISQAK